MVTSTSCPNLLLQAFKWATGMLCEHAMVHNSLSHLQPATACAHRAVLDLSLLRGQPLLRT